MTPMMPQGRGGARGAEGGRHLIRQVIGAVGEFSGAAAQTPCAGAWGLARVEGANMGAAWAPVAGLLGGGARSRRQAAPADARGRTRWWLILSDQAIPHRATVALF